MVKWNLLIRRRLIGSEDPANNVGPRSGATDVRKLVKAERLDDVVEIRGSEYREASEEDGSGIVEQRLEPWFVGFDGVCELSEIEVVCGGAG